MLIVETIAEKLPGVLDRADRFKRSAVSCECHGRSFGRSSDQRRPSSVTSERRNLFRRLGRGGTSSINYCWQMKGEGVS